MAAELAGCFIHGTVKFRSLGRMTVDGGGGRIHPQAGGILEAGNHLAQQECGDDAGVE